MRVLIAGLALSALFFAALAVRGTRSNPMHVTAAPVSASAPVSTSAPVSASAPVSGAVGEVRARYGEFVRAARLDQPARMALDAALVDLGQLLERGPRMHADESGAFYFAAFERTLSQIERTLPPSAIALFRARIAPILPALLEAQTGRAPKDGEELSFAEIYTEFMRQFDRPSP